MPAIANMLVGCNLSYQLLWPGLGELDFMLSLSVHVCHYKYSHLSIFLLFTHLLNSFIDFHWFSLQSFLFLTFQTLFSDVHAAGKNDYTFNLCLPEVIKQWQKCHESLWHCLCHTCGLLSSEILLSVSCFVSHCNNTTFMCTCKEKEKSYMCLISVLWCFDVKPTRGWCLDEQRGCRIPHRISRLSFSAKRSRCFRTNLDLVQDSTWIQRSPVNPLCLCMHF